MRKNPALLRKEALEKLEQKGIKTHTDEAPGELVLFMAKSKDDRKTSNVRWSDQKDIFRTGNYPQLAWNLYECHPDVDKTLPPTVDTFFKTIRDLGHGSFGKVRLVELKVTGERLAMKVMDKEMCPKALRTKELHAFIQIGVSPFIVRFHSCFQNETACYLLMQFHCGGSLAKIIEEFGLLCEPTARFFTAEVVEGLLHLHSRGIIHRDIKLANILLGVDNHVRICDLGLCKLGMTGKARTHTRCGALRYCAPEVLAREWYSKEVDWWSLGVVLFRMLTGQYPFDAPVREDIEDLIKNSDPNLNLVPEGPARDIINSFLEKKAEKRLGSGEYADSLIRKHPFFNEINWDDLQARKAKAPSVQKRFLRRGSIIRRLAFGPDDPNASRTRTIVRRLLNFLVRLVILVALVCLVMALQNPDTRKHLQETVAQFSLQIKESFEVLKMRVLDMLSSGETPEPKN